MIFIYVYITNIRGHSQSTSISEYKFIEFFFFVPLHMFLSHFICERVENALYNYL